MTEEAKNPEKEPQASLFSRISNYLKQEHEKSWGKKREPTGLRKRMIDYLQTKKDKNIEYQKWRDERIKSGEWKNMTARERRGGPDYEKRQRDRGKEGKECSPLEALFEMLYASIGAALENLFCAVALILVGLFLSLIPVICVLGWLALFAGCVYALYAIFVVPFATFLRGGKTTSNKPLNLPKNIVPDVGTPMWEEQQVEKIKEQKRREQRAQEQLAKEKEQEEAAARQAKVDLGFGKKVRFEDLPKHLQEQILEQCEKERLKERKKG